MSDIFAGVGHSVKTINIPASAYITLLVNKEDVLDMLVGKAPVTGIAISERIDMELNRSMGGSWMLSTFGHKPVSIVIRGLEFYSSECKAGGDTANATSIQDFYDKYNVFDNSELRISVGLSATGSASAGYTAVMVGLDREAGTGNNVLDVGSYKLSLLAVKVSA